MSNVYQRIGEAMASQGKIKLVLALNEDERTVLKNAGFTSAGFVDINGSNVEVFDISPKPVYIPTIQTDDWWNKTIPRSPSVTPPWTTTGPSPYTPIYTPHTYCGTSVEPRLSSYVQPGGETDALLSAIAGGYAIPGVENKTEEPRRVLKLDVNSPEDLDMIKQVMTEQHTKK